VIVAPTVGPRGESLNWVWAGAASIISVLVHAGLIVLIMTISLGGTGELKASDSKEKPPEMEEDKQDADPDLSNEEVGSDPTKSIQYNVDLIKDVSVPGPISPSDSPGIKDAPDAPPRSLSAPPGAGNGTGLSPIASDDGKGIGYGTIGGMGGIYQAGGFGGRTGSTREKLLQEYGGNAISEASVASGLGWLALHQAQDGRWSLHEFNRHAREKPYPAGKVFMDNSEGTSNRKNDIAATGFGLLPFLAGGQTHRPSKTNKVDYSKTVKAGLEFLIRKQDKSTGFYGGDMYAHGIATIAMCEAYGMTSDNLLKASAQRAIDYIQSSQDKGGGGWRYSPNTAGDLSVTGWQMMALKSGQMSGLSVREGTMKKAEQFIKSCEAQWTGPDGKTKKGGYSYLPGSGETPTMTAVGMLCSQYLGTTPRNPELISGAERLKLAPPNATKNLYYEYYATQVMHHMGGDNWKFWNEGPNGASGIRDTLIRKQDIGAGKPAHRGSWAQEGGGHANDGGRIMATSLSLLCLEVYYRHLPLYRRDMNLMKDAK
jgi:hypothetical protein